MFTFSDITSESGRLWKKSLKPVSWWLLGFVIIEELVNEGFGYIRDLGNEKTLVLALMLSIIFQLLLSAVSIIVINQVLYNVRLQERVPLLPSLKQNFKYVFIESARAFLPVILKCLLLIIPGLVEAVRLYFVPYIAQFDRLYKEGQVDALEKSRALVKGRFWFVTGVLIFSFLLSIVPRFWLQSFHLTENPGYYALVFLLCLATELYADVILFVMYEKIAEEQFGSQVSFPGNPESGQSLNV